MDDMILSPQDEELLMRVESTPQKFPVKASNGGALNEQQVKKLAKVRKMVNDLYDKHMKEESKQMQLKGMKMIATDFINKL